ncbi:hypothetical protein ABZV64_17480 [Streptomyces sp. NPDC004959]|uniref:hypothetical protein n=1 Tax=unclassified Streptomyces TaxID=2593676 RepID=UPI0004CAF9B0|nr:hypothetical protein [Streptomyces sp. NRRL F-5630]
MANPPGGPRPTPHAAVPSAATDAERAAGALLLCRAEPDEAARAARLLRRPLVLCPAGEAGPDGEARWSALVPEDKPWLHGGEPVDRVLTGWATALAVGASWPVLALWWDHERAGLVLCSGFRRPVGYEWAGDGTPLGEDEAMRTFVLRLGLDPVLDLQELGPLSREDPESDARARLRGVLAVLARAGLRLPAGLVPGEPADRLRSVAAVVPGNRLLSWSGWRDAVRDEIDAVEHGALGPWLRGPGARLLAGAQCAVGLPLLAYGLRRRDHGWCCAGTLLVAHGLSALAYDRMRAARGWGRG